MAARSIFVTWPMESDVRAILERVGTVHTSTTEHELPISDLIRHVADVEAIIPMGAHSIPEPVIAAAPRLRIVAVAAVGYNIVDVAAATRRGILVTNTLGVARRVPESDRFVRAGKWTGVYWSQLMGTDVHGGTLGIIGLGRIGQAIARRAQGFGMRVLYHKRTPDPEAARGVGAEYRTKAELLRESDFVVLSIPLTPETRHLIGAAELALMKPTAFLVNVARGPVVDEAALVEALRAKRIAGAGLDVFEDEPKLHPGLLGLEHLALTPHIGSASGATRRRMATRAADDCIAALEGHRPPDLVNPDGWRAK